MSKPPRPLVEWPHDPAFDARRAAANAELLGRLRTYLEASPGMRFGQALVNLGVVDTPHLFNEEPGVTLGRVRARSRD